MGKGIYKEITDDDKKLDKQKPSISNFGGQHFPDKVNYYRPAFEGSGIADGTFRLFDMANPDDALFDAVEQEQIAITSPPILLYRLNTDRTEVDEVTGESQIRFYNKFDRIVGNYEAPDVEQQLSRFGIAEQEEIEIIFNLNYLFVEVGGQIDEGDLIRTVDGKMWEVIDSVVGDEALWTKGHNKCVLKRVQGEGYLIPDDKNPGKYIDISDSPNTGSRTGRDKKGEDSDLGSGHEPL